MPATVQGTVFAPSGHKFKLATVKVFTASGLNPVAHLKTDPNGRYSFTTLSPGTYVIMAAVENEFAVPPPRTFSIGSSGTLTIDFNLFPFPNGFNLNAIYGQVKTSLNNTPVSNALVTINNITNTPTLFATTYTNIDGQYFVDNLPVGTYSVQASAKGFNISELITAPISTDSLTAKNVPLTINEVDTLGTVSGTITDKTTGLPLNNASVGLYQLNQDGTETLIGLTRTQANGLYLFTNVQPGQTYLVKAKLVQ